MKILPGDTIAAVATPPGEGALAVIRISGPGALAVGDAVFRGRTQLGAARGFTVHHGTIVDRAGREVDEALATVFRAPHSYTGEDVVEFSCHGGTVVTRAVLNASLSAGARRAEPGEFTRRAFLNGKMDLSRAEAVSALIAARSERACRASLAQLQGRLASAVGELKSELMNLCALLEIDLDFSEEELSVVGKEEIASTLESVRSRLAAMAGTFRSGKIYRDGISVVIAGEPNVGKSSLFNALLKESRAIVTPVPGTTRDYLEESIFLDGVLFKITDTAGLRSSDDPVESEGIARSFSALQHADIVLMVVDASSREDGGTEPQHRISLRSGQVGILVRNKVDLPGAKKPGRKEGEPPPKAEISVSSLTGEGIHSLAALLAAEVGVSEGEAAESVCVMSERHAESLMKGARSLGTALSSLRTGMTNEFVAFDVRECVTSLSEITGEITSEDLLNSIFARFCVGK